MGLLSKIGQKLRETGNGSAAFGQGFEASSPTPRPETHIGAFEKTQRPPPQQRNNSTASYHSNHRYKSYRDSGYVSPSEQRGFEQRETRDHERRGYDDRWYEQQRYEERRYDEPRREEPRWEERKIVGYNDGYGEDHQTKRQSAGRGGGRQQLGGGANFKRSNSGGGETSFGQGAGSW